MSMFRSNFGHPSWVRQRELGTRLSLGYADAFYKGLYSSIVQCHSSVRKRFVLYGGIYSMDFSPDGSLLLATSDRNSIKMFDPLSQKLLKTINDAQRGRIKKLKFLDSRVFASGGDDKTIALWDIRNLRSKMCSLRGRHPTSVRNIEFSSKENLLLTNGCQENIYSWDISSLTGRQIVSNKVFHSNDLLCMRLTPDESKMIVSTLRGYLLIVHDLDLKSLAEDLCDFNPGEIPFESLQEAISDCDVTGLSRRPRRNRVEVVTDFPVADGGSAVTALEVHPQGVSALSRSSCKQMQLQWLCVHDIRDKAPPPGGREDGELGGGGAGRERLAAGSSLGDTQTVGEESGERGLTESTAGSRRASPQETEEEVGSSASSGFPVPRLTHYAQRKSQCVCLNEELGFSPDGRVICSPCGYGIKLHSFSPECFEQFVSWPGGQPISLHEFATYIFHRSSMIHCVKFSPRHCLIVSGDLRGRINWYQPVL